MNTYIEEINLNDALKIIKENNLNPNDITDYTAGLFINNKLIGAASLYKNIIKLVAIKKEYQQENLLSIIITHLVNRLTSQGYLKYFLFTEENKKHYFINLGFKEIVSALGVSYLENNIYTISDKLTDLKNNLKVDSSSVGAIICNCNPPTLGHLYLIKEAKKKHDLLLVFLVSEDKSFFPYEVRERLLKESLKDLNNVIVLPSTKYLISSSTFPTYFLKDPSLKSEVEMHLDAKIFKEYFIPIFNIEKRYVGTEDIDPFTKLYNGVLKEHLKDSLQVIQRKKINDTFISASLVRKYFKEKNFEEIKKLTPKPTYEFLISSDARRLLK